MNKKLIHLKNDLGSFKKTYLICLILVLSFGIYKNIIGLIGSDISMAYLLSRILFILFGLSIGLLSDYLKTKKLNFGFNALSGLIVSMIVPFSTNLIIYLISLSFIVLLDFIDKDNKLNKICLVKIISVILLMIMGDYTYLNSLESSYEYAYTLGDIFIGNQVGGIFSTSVLFILLSLIILSVNKIYKSKISLISLGSYLLVLIGLLLTKDYMNIFLMMLNSTNIFAFVFIAPFSIYSPYENKEMIIYSLIVGIGSAFLTYFINPYEGAIVAILVANIFILLLKKFHKSTNNA